MLQKELENLNQECQNLTETNETLTNNLMEERKKAFSKFEREYFNYP